MLGGGRRNDARAGGYPREPAEVETPALNLPGHGKPDREPKS